MTRTCVRSSIGRIVLAVTVFASAANAAGFAITPTFDAGYTASEIAVINSAISFYQTALTSPITVTIRFSKILDGLGTSSTTIYLLSYQTYITALRSHTSSA